MDWTNATGQTFTEDSDENLRFVPECFVAPEPDPLAGWDECPDCREGFVLATGADAPWDTRWVCSLRCGWEA